MARRLSAIRQLFKFLVADGVLTEHWDVLQDEATEAESKSGLPMFGDTFPATAQDA